MANFRDILLMQKRELEQKMGERYVQKDASLKRGGGLIQVIMGPRRAGKSFFAMRELGKGGKFAYVNFDDERLAPVADYDAVFAAAASVYGGQKTMLLDEIQNVGKWELLANRLQRQGYRLVLTGSNAHLLGRELATHLTGRYLEAAVLPFSFGEYLKAHGGEITDAEKKAKFDEYAVCGGYPEPLLNKLNYKEYLSTLMRATIYKDIVNRFRIRKPQAVERLSFQLISNAANEISYNALSQASGISSVNTIEKYLGYLEETFLFFKLARFSYKSRQLAAFGKKIYCIDNGFIGACGFSASPDWGRLYENAAAVALKKEELEGRLKFYFWKNEQGEEVDFAIKRGNAIVQLVQVCFEPQAVKTKEREVRALLKAGAQLRCKRLLVLTGEYEATESVEWFGIRGKVEFVPLWKWLLQPQKFES